MEIGPIFRSLIRHKSRFWLIVLEIGLTLAVVANCLHIIMDYRARILRPTGIDEGQVLRVASEPFAPAFEDPAYAMVAYKEDLRMIRSLPGVRAAASTSAVPMSGSGSVSGFRRAGSDADGRRAAIFTVSEGFVDSLGVDLAEGRDFVESDFAAEGQGLPSPNQRSNVIVTQAFAEALFPDGGALGGVIEAGRDSAYTIVGIVRLMHGPWAQVPFEDSSVIFPQRGPGGRITWYLVRADPGQVDRLYTEVESALLRLNEGRIVSVRSLEEVKRRSYSMQIVAGQLMGAISLLLVIVTATGIVGLTSFSVTQRVREIGTRRALGATRPVILRHFLVENWIVTSVGLVLGIALTYGLNLALSRLADVPRIGLPVVVSGMLILWVVGLLAALTPALRGAAVAPVVATRTV